MWPFDQNNQHVYQQYAQAHETGNYNAIDPVQAVNHLIEFIRTAPPGEQERVYQQHFAQLSPEQRSALAQQMPPDYAVNADDPASLAQGFQRLGQEQPDMLQRILSHPLVVGAAVSLVSIVAKHILERRGGYAR